MKRAIFLFCVLICAFAFAQTWTGGWHAPLKVGTTVSGGDTTGMALLKADTARLRTDSTSNAARGALLTTLDTTRLDFSHFLYIQSRPDEGFDSLGEYPPPAPYISASVIYDSSATAYCPGTTGDLSVSYWLRLNRTSAVTTMVPVIPWTSRVTGNHAHWSWEIDYTKSEDVPDSVVISIGGDSSYYWLVTHGVNHPAGTGVDKITFGNWYHICWTHQIDGDSSRDKIWVNAKLYKYVAAKRLNLWKGMTELQMGEIGNGANNFLGSLKHLIIGHAVWDSTHIAGLYNSGKGLKVYAGGYLDSLTFGANFDGNGTDFVGAKTYQIINQWYRPAIGGSVDMTDTVKVVIFH
jgi:hypothetical protein